MVRRRIHSRRNICAASADDQIFYYHTGDEKSVIGIAKAVTDAYPDPADKTGKAHVVDLAPVRN